MDNLQIVRERTELKIQSIVQHCRGAFGYAVIDLTSGEHFGLNDSLVFPTASAIKVPILMEVFKQATAGKFKLSDRRTIEHAKTLEGDLLHSFSDNGSQLSIHDLCVMMIVLSDNSATNMLIDLVGMDNVNRTLSSIGLKKTRLQRRMMDIEASARGDENLSTPLEAARLMQALYSGKFLNRETSEKVLDVLKLPKETEGKIRSVLPSDVQVAYKSGEILPAVITEWAVVYLKGSPFVLVMMGNYGLEEDGATAMKEISKAVYDYFWRVGRASPHGTYKDPSLWK